MVVLVVVVRSIAPIASLVHPLAAPVPIATVVLVLVLVGMVAAPHPPAMWT